MPFAYRGSRGTQRPPRHARGWRWAAAGLPAAAVLAAGCGSSAPAKPATSTTPPAPTTSAPAHTSAAAPTTSAPSSSAAAKTTLKTTKIAGVAVVTDAAGHTLYWFVPDTSTKSNCNGSCASIWPPVAGPATAGTGVTGKLGTITRSDGSTQATYDGHPLYTYVADTKPGQASGNGLNLSGGIWHEMTVSGAVAASSKSSSTSTGGGGY
jgi:predicted lipoprotein with Yx(FWY)xxD motif